MEDNNDVIKIIINKFAEIYGINYEALKPISGGYQNLVFEFIQNNKPYILRISDSNTRSIEEINSELEWCIYLQEHGVILSKPLSSLSGLLTETADVDGVRMTASLFEKAPGRKMSYPEYLNNTEIFKQLGQITGKIHKVSKTYTMTKFKRSKWNENYYLKNFYKFIPQTEIEIINAYERLMLEFSLLSHNENSFGPIHGDINVGNFCILDEQITLYDFDECQYSWFVEDIAIQLFYTVYPFGDDSVKERQEMADKFMNYFMNGYYSENNLDDYWIAKIPEFLKLRELIVHVGLYKKWDLDNLNQWQKDYFNQSANRIKNGLSLVKYTESWNSTSV